MFNNLQRLTMNCDYRSKCQDYTVFKQFILLSLRNCYYLYNIILLFFKGRFCNGKESGIMVNREMVNISDNAVHLGHTISFSDREGISLTAKSSFSESFDSFISNFGHTYSFIKCSLFKQFWCSFYGSPLWNLNGPGAQSLCVDWRNSLMSLWRVHPMTHCDVIAALSDQFPIKVSFERRFIRFIKKCLSSSNSIVNVISHIAICNPMSTAGKNYRSVLDCWTLMVITILIKW